jgi:triacylglycerol esterase/lipase EstA (alpha/beta hydrolase family)
VTGAFVAAAALAATALAGPALASPVAASTAKAGAGSTGTGSASAGPLPVDYSFAAGFTAGFGFPTTAPPGANNFGCRPTAAHPHPVILVNGTFENQNDNWRAAAPLLANHGYCVFAFNYGGVTAAADVQGTQEIAASARQLASFVATVLAATGAAKADLVGHSQGGMMPRYYIEYLGGAAKTNALVGLAPSNYGTTLDGLSTFVTQLGLADPFVTGLSALCESCGEQIAGSSFLATVNATPTSPGVQYTVIESRDDEVVTPYTNAFLPAAPNVTNITVQNQCLLDQSDHLELAYDPVAMADMLNALDPADPVRIPCVPVLPVTGPTVPVPSY